MHFCISNIWVPVNCQMPFYLLSSIFCDYVHVTSSQLSIFSVLMLGLCNCVAKMRTFCAEENFTSHDIVSHDNYCRFSWNFQAHMICLFDVVSLNWMSQTTKCFMSKGKSTALTTYCHYCGRICLIQRKSGFLTADERWKQAALRDQWVSAAAFSFKQCS